MRFYINYDKNNQINMWQLYPYENQTAIEVTKDEFYRLRKEYGFDDVPYEEPSTTDDYILDQEYRISLLELGGI